MSRMLLLALLLFTSLSPAWTQKSFGLTLGTTKVSFPRAGANSNDNPEIQSDWAPILQASYLTADASRLRTTLALTYLGRQSEVEISGIRSSDYDLDLGYLLFEVKRGWYFFRQLGLYGDVGFYMAMPIRKRVREDWSVFMYGRPPSIRSGTREEPDEVIRTVDLGGSISLGYEYRVGNRLALLIQARYGYSFLSGKLEFNRAAADRSLALGAQYWLAAY